MTVCPTGMGSWSVFRDAHSHDWQVHHLHCLVDLDLWCLVPLFSAVSRVQPESAVSCPFCRLHPQQESSCPGVTTMTKPDCGAQHKNDTYTGQMVLQEEKIYFLQKG